MAENLPLPPAPDDEAAWSAWRDEWQLRPGTVYLNHGSFGPPPKCVREARRGWIDQLDSNPIDLFMYRQEEALQQVIGRLAEFVGAPVSDLVLVENATDGMNAVAWNFPLSPGDEVLLTDHEYGAVLRIWQRAARRAGAAVTIARVPFPPESDEQIVASIAAAMTPRTKLVVVSHITSPTALIFPVEAICRAVHERGAAVCVDGPHAIAQLPLDVTSLDCDYYTASCHKWLCAPFGSGFLYVHSRHQATFEPPLLSWGRLQPAQPARWSDEYLWTGTRDRSAQLAIDAAIDFLQRVGLPAFRARTHYLSELGSRMVNGLTGNQPMTDSRFHASMFLAELPVTDAPALRDQLHHRYAIEIPVVDFAGRRFLRISTHLYNSPVDLERLVQALRELL